MKKRIFSLLIAICLLAALPLHALAFYDDASIQHPEAVQKLVDIGVINGYPDGSFQPYGTLTRAEASAILTRLDWGYGDETAPFTDVPDSHWAASYISYCAEMGYVSGYGDGRFGPEDTLTGSAWSKMLLCQQGYDAETTGMLGTYWATGVAALAESEQLYRGLSNFNPSRAVTRDEACQIAYNAVFAPGGDEPKPTTPPDPPSDNGILSRLTYDFSNSRSAFDYPVGYRIPYERYRMVFGDTEIARKTYENVGAWGGNCYGLSSTSGMFYQPGNGVSVTDFRASAAKPSDLLLSDRNSAWNLSLRDFIEVMHVSQFSPLIQADYSNNRDLDALIQAVRAFQNGSGGPVIIAVFGPEGGHAILGYALEEVSDSLSRLLVYDCNFPHDATRAVSLYRNNAGDYYGWYYPLNDAYDWGSDYYGCAISYIPYSDYYSLWTSRAEKTVSSMALLTVSGDVTVSTANGRTMAQIRDGDVISYGDNILPYIEIGLTIDGSGSSSGTVGAWLPAGSYTIENDSPGEINVTFTHVEQSVTVQTSADAMTLKVDDASSTRTARLGASQGGSSFSITIESTLADEDEPSVIVLEGTVSDEGLTLGQEDGSFVSQGVDPGDVVIIYDGAVG